jgi:4-coumarate--CoA ligase
MPFPIAGHVPISAKDLLSWIFDDPEYDIDKPVSLSIPRCGILENREYPSHLSSQIFISASDPSVTLSCAQSLSLIRHLIAGLRHAGLQPGDCVCIQSFNSVTYPILVLAIIGAGGVFAGTNPSYTPHELAHTLKISKARFVLAEKDLLPSMREAMISVKIPESRLFILDAQDEAPPSIPFKPTNSSHSNPIFQSWRALLTHGTATWTRFNSPTRSKDTTAAFFFSSGTTGLPKATQITHHNLIAQHTLVFTPHPRPYPISVVLCIPMFHIGIGPLTHVSHLRDGRTAYIMRRFDLESFLKLHARFQVTECLIVPPIVNAIVMSGLADPNNSRYRAECSLQSLRHGLGGGAPLGAVMQKRFQILMAPGASLGQLWGMTEMTCIITHVRLGTRSEEVDYFGSVGTPIPNTELKIVDEDGKDVSHVPDVRGEICVRGPTVMKGYFENEEANKETFDDEGYIMSGDIGYVDSKTGLWYIVDRRKELIKVRGFQVAPPEIEGVLLSHPGIADVAVIGVKMRVEGGPSGSEWDERPRAYVVRQAGAVEVQEEQVKDWVVARLAKYKSLDGGVRFVDAIPRNASGKILKRIVREWAKEEKGKPVLKL